MVQMLSMQTACCMLHVSSNSALGSAFRTKGVHNGPDGDELSLAERAHLRVASYRLGRGLHDHERAQLMHWIPRMAELGHPD